MVRLKLNDFGLFDMQGDVWEWCHDYYEEDYYKQSPEQDPQGPASRESLLSGFFRVLRGGACDSISHNSRSANRFFDGSDSRNFYCYGFRLVRELD